MVSVLCLCMQPQLNVWDVFEFVDLGLLFYFIFFFCFAMIMCNVKLNQDIRYFNYFFKNCY
jgi:hypothetical protein